KMAQNQREGWSCVADRLAIVYGGGGAGTGIGGGGGRPGGPGGCTQAQPATKIHASAMIAAKVLRNVFIQLLSFSNAGGMPGPCKSNIPQNGGFWKWNCGFRRS